MKTPSERFWAKVDVRGADECWPWTAHRDKDGYGRFRVGSTKVPASRFAWSDVNSQSVPVCLLIRHTCHNPWCCNPKHLLPGTALDNSRDMIEAGRSLTGDRNPSRLHKERMRRGDNHPHRMRPELRPRGEENMNSVLTTEEVYEIRLRAAAKWETQSRIAEDYKVSQVLVSRIHLRKAWKHLPELTDVLTPKSYTDILEKVRQRSSKGEGKENDYEMVG